MTGTCGRSSDIWRLSKRSITRPALFSNLLSNGRRREGHLQRCPFRLSCSPILSCPIESYFSQLEPPEDTEIWRFMPLSRFEDLMANEELFFCRADLFPQDENEGIPPEDYVRRAFNLRRYDIQDEKTLIHQMGTLAQEREMFYASCWHLARDERPEMWKGFAETGVAIISRYESLKGVSDGLLDRGFLGLVRYGEEHLITTMRVNVMQYITTKRIGYQDGVK